MINYKKAEQAKELLQECGASFIIAYNDSNNDDVVCASGNYIILKSLIIGTMAQAALGVRGKYGEEMAMQELMSMMAEAEAPEDFKAVYYVDYVKEVPKYE